MTDKSVRLKKQQSLLEDQFFYFFLRLRKNRCEKVVKDLQKRYPNDAPEKLARRLLSDQRILSFLGGALMHLPAVIPGAGRALTVLGIAGGTSVVTRMHLYLILEIALIFGKDIDDEARVKEMALVVATTQLAASTPLFIQALSLHPLYAIPVGGYVGAAVAQAVGETAIRFYRDEALLDTGPELLPQET